MNETINIAQQFAEGEACLRRGELEQARGHYLSVLQGDPAHADAMFALANIDAKTGHMDDAERVIRQALSVNPTHAGYFNALGNILKSTQRLDEAEQVYKHALKLMPKFSTGYNNLGEVYQIRGDLDAALECYFKALEIDPNFAGAYNNIGRAMNNKQRLDEAAEAFIRAIELNPGLPEAHNNLGHIYRARGKLNRAAGCFETAIELDPSFSSAHRNLGTILMSRQKPGDAVQCFERSLELDNTDVLSAVNLGIALHTVGRLNDAVKAYNRAIKMDPENPDIHLDLGVALNEQRRTDEAITSIKEAIRLNPNLGRAYADLAALYEDTNLVDDAWEAIQKGLALEPENPRMILEAGKLMRRRGEIGEATKMLECINLDEVDHRLAQYIHYELGLCLDRESDADRAFDHFTQANHYARKNERLQTVDPKRYLAKIDDLQRFFDQISAAQWKKGQSEPVANAPVFLYGFPRSGTTLIDVILNAHPSIRTLEEKPTIFAIEQNLKNREEGYPDSLANLSSEDLEALRIMYFKMVDEHADREAGIVVVDKMPIRTVHAGLLERLFPGARVLFSVRHPCDVCLSAYMQQFNTSDAFANFFTLEDTVRIYDKVMTLWRRYVDVLSIDARLIRYEDLLDNFEPSVRRLLNLAGVEWDPDVVEFTHHAKNRGRIATNSYHQVTEPLYQRAKYRWHRYKKHFMPFMDTLRPHIAYFGYEE